MSTTVTEAQEKAQAAFASASKTIHNQQTGKAGNAAETRYGETYQKLVQMGLAPRLKRKHTTPKRYR